MQNIENICYLYFYLEGFLNDLTIKYIIKGNQKEIKKLYESIDVGNKLLTSFLPKVKDISKRYDVEINEEVVPYNHPTASKEVKLTCLHIGTKANELNQAYVTNFIGENLKKMGFKLTRLSCLMYYLPEIPAVISNKGIITIPYGGFYSLRNKRIEINIHSSFTSSQIYESLVHEIFHFMLMNDLTMQNSEIMVDVLVDEYFNISKNEFKKNSLKILVSLEKVIEKKIIIHNKFNYGLNEIGKDIKSCSNFVKNCRKIQENLVKEIIIAVPIAEDLEGYSIKKRNLHL